jgi:hypothetical protein
MISVSQLAASVLFQTIEESRIEPGKSLRLVEQDERFELEIDEPRRTDRVVRFQGAVVLIVDKRLDEAIQDGRIDVEETAAGHDLVFRRTAKPKAIDERLVPPSQDD